MYVVIDIGSNTMRLVVYKIEDDKIVPMINKKKAVGLAGYINSENHLKKKGIEKAIEVLNEFQEIIDHMKIKEVFPFATASIRNIKNSNEVLDEIKKKSGFNVTILSGDEEATFDYYGAIQSVKIDDGLLVDIGGGSTELVFFKNKEVISTTSLPIGSLNQYKKYVTNLLPTNKDLKDIKHHTKELLKDVKLPKKDVSLDVICGVGGTIRATEKLLKNMDIISSSEYKASHIEDIFDALKEDKKSFYQSLLETSPDRIHTFLTGLIIFDTIINFYESKTIITSRYGVREGYLYYLLEERGVINNGKNSL